MGVFATSCILKNTLRKKVWIQSFCVDDGMASFRPETEEERILKEEIEHLKKQLLTKSDEDQTSIHGIILQKEQDSELLIRQLDDKVRYSQKIFERQSSGSSRGAGFNDRPPSRPGSHEGPRAGFHDRPPSASGPYEQHRTGYLERPPSRPGGYDDSRAGFTERPPSRPGAYEENTSVYPQQSSITHGVYQESRGGDYNERPRSRGAMSSWTRPSDDRRSFESGWGRASSGSRDMERYFHFGISVFEIFSCILQLSDSVPQVDSFLLLLTDENSWK